MEIMICGIINWTCRRIYSLWGKSSVPGWLHCAWQHPKINVSSLLSNKASTTAGLRNSGCWNYASVLQASALNQLAAWSPLPSQTSSVNKSQTIKETDRCDLFFCRMV
jgi:hypothetical protein